MALLNAGLQAAVQGAKEHNSLQVRRGGGGGQARGAAAARHITAAAARPRPLPSHLQCFYLACQLAYWVRGQAMAPHIHQRSPLLAELQVLWRAWDPAPRGKASGSGLGLSTWCVLRPG